MSDSLIPGSAVTVGHHLVEPGQQPGHRARADQPGVVVMTRAMPEPDSAMCTSSALP